MASYVAEQSTSDYKLLWFRKNQGTVEPAQNALEGHEQFKLFAQGLLKGKNKDVHFVATENDLKKQLNDLDLCQLREHANEDLHGAKRIKGSYDLARESGARKGGRKLQDFFKTFSDFIGAYSGIIELVKNAGQQYGEAAYQTLSILLIVVVNKSQNDNQITQLLSDLQNAFPRMDTLLGVYPSSTLEHHVASLYKEVIMFTRDATIYFMKFSVRLWTAIGKPPSVGIVVTNKTIMALLAEVNAEALVLLHERNYEIYKGVQKLTEENSNLMGKVNILQRTVEESHFRIQDLQLKNNELLKNVSSVEAESRLMRENSDFKLRQEDADNLEQIATKLNFALAANLSTEKVKWPCIETDIEYCSREILNAFPNKDTSHRKKCTRYEHMTPELLQSQAAYIKWSKSSTSALFFLHGPTAIESRLEVTATTYSWLSPAASHVAQAISQDEKAFLAYYCCHPELRAEKRQTSLILSALIYQLLLHRPSILRKKKRHYYELAAHFIKKEDISGVEGMIQFLREVLVEANEMAYIIIDRVDQCSFSTLTIMDQLAALVVGPNCKVKIMVTCDTSFSKNWDMYARNVGELERKLMKERVYAQGPWMQKMV